MTEFDWKQALSKPPVEHGPAGFTEELRQKIHAQAASRSRKSPRRIRFWLGGGVAAAVAAVLLLTPVTGLWSNMNAAKTITDSYTPETVPVVTKTDDSTVIWSFKDGDPMNRGGSEYNQFDVLIDEDFRTAASLKRGDVILYSTPRKAFEQHPNYEEPDNYKSMHRVVGLPGETVEIRDAQIYIDGKKLDTFYGSFHYLGMSFEEYLKWGQENNIFIGALPKKSNEQMAPIKVPAGHVFVIGDFWSRSYMDSRHYGSLSETDIIGKVLGYYIRD